MNWRTTTAVNIINDRILKKVVALLDNTITLHNHSLTKIRKDLANSVIIHYAGHINFTDEFAISCDFQLDIGDEVVASA